MKKAFIFSTVVCLFISGVASADTFGTGSNQFEIDFVPISGDTNPTSGFGIVNNDYRIGMYQITNSQWTSFEAETDLRFTSSAWAGNNIPVTMKNWYAAAQFVNWLNEEAGYTKAYNFDNGVFHIWDSSQAAEGTNLYRHKDAFYFLPTVDEWIKAAYWNGTNLQTYATKDNSVPIAGFDSNYNQSWPYNGPWSVGSGSEELNGTYDMMGNVFDWIESPCWWISNDYLPDAHRILLGGTYNFPENSIDSEGQSGDLPADEARIYGFRIASVMPPNPLQFEIDAATDGDTIIVHPGVYEGPLYMKGKNITLTSTDPTNPDVVAATVLDGLGLGTVITFDGTENQTCVLNGLTITGGWSDAQGGGIRGNDCTAAIRNCVFRDNTVVGAVGGGIWGIGGSISNCIFENNHASIAGGGLARCGGVISNCLFINNSVIDTYGAALHNCDGSIVNCTLVNDKQPVPAMISYCDGVFENCIVQAVSGPIFSSSTAVTRYCCYPGATGTGDIDADPLFIDATNGDYHLQMLSPCIDAGDPASDYSNEPQPNSERINMGAYGNTSEATIAPWANKWTKLLAPDGSERDNFGCSVSIDGDFAIVGASRNNGGGSAYIYRYNGATWTQQAKLMASDGRSFGCSVSIDGDVAIMGASTDEDNGWSSGAAYIFRYNGATWIQESKLTAIDGAQGDSFGNSVSIDGNTAIVGAFNDDDHGARSGSAYIFYYDGISWTQQAKLTATDGAEDDSFGISVVIEGDTAIVGADRADDDNGSNSGSAYIFRYNGATWTQESKLTAIDSDQWDFFGTSVSLDGNTAIVGASGDDDNGPRSGSAYIFHYDGISWTQQAKLTASDGLSYTYFGNSVSIDGDAAIVGANRDDENGDRAGAAYIFRYDGSSWTQQVKLLADDGATLDHFGYSVSVSDGVFYIGAPYDDDNGDNSGSVYVFDTSRLHALEYITVSGLELVSKQRVGRTVFEYVYQLEVSNSHSESISDVTINLMPLSNNITVIEGEVLISEIAAGATIVTDDTVTLRVDRAAGPASAEWLIEYGASQAQTTQPTAFGLLADIVENGKVDLADLQLMMDCWLSFDPAANIAGDTRVNLADFAVLASEWMH